MSRRSHESAAPEGCGARHPEEGLEGPLQMATPVLTPPGERERTDTREMRGTGSPRAQQHRQRRRGGSNGRSDTKYSACVSCVPCPLRAPPLLGDNNLRSGTVGEVISLSGCCERTHSAALQCGGRITGRAGRSAEGGLPRRRTLKVAVTSGWSLRVHAYVPSWERGRGEARARISAARQHAVKERGECVRAPHCGEWRRARRTGQVGTGRDGCAL